MKKVVFLIRSLNVGGAERQLLTLTAALDRNRFDPVVVMFYPGGTLLPDFEKQGIRVLAAGKSRRWDMLSFLTGLTRLVQAEKPDVLVSYLVAANILAVTFQKMWKVPRVMTSIRHSFLRREDYDWLAAVMYWLEDRLTGRSERVIINSYVGAREAARRGIPERKILVIPNGIDTEKFVASSESRKAKRMALGYNPEDILIGMVGRLDPVKDHAGFIQAAGLLTGANSHLRFLIVGDGTETFRDNLQQKISGAGLESVFKIIPGEADPVPVYNALDICVSASVGEGFSNVIAEAMSCEVPCVVTDVGDSGMIVGNTGRVVPAGSPQDLAVAIASLAEMPESGRKRLGSEARERIKEEFSVVKMVTATSAEFDRLG